MDKKLYESSHTMLMTDTIRNSSKMTILNERARATILTALNNDDEDLIYDAIDFLNASIGFIDSPYIESQYFIDTLLPLIKENILILENSLLAIDAQKLKKLNQNFEFIRAKSQTIDQEVWSAFTNEYVRFRAQEYQIYIFFQGVALVVSILLSFIIFLFYKQRLLVTSLSSSEKELKHHKIELETIVAERTDSLIDANKRLETNQYQLETIIDNLPVVLFTKDKAGTHQVVNKEYEKAVGSTKENILGKTDYDLFPCDVADKIRDIDTKIMSENKAHNFQEKIPHPDGTLHDYDTTKIPLVDESGKAHLLLGITNDITEQNKLEENLVEAKNLAEVANQAKSNFLANMSHELRTPMNAIIGMTYLALKSELTEKQNNYITKVHQSAESLLMILNDILDFSKVEAGKLEIEQTPFQLKNVIDHMVNMIKFKCTENNIQLIIKLAHDIPKNLLGDPLRLGQVLINLASNAEKFSQSGDTITLNVSLKEDDGEQVIILFSIEDTGIGISQEQQNKLFKSFSQADSSTTREFGGTGLGLVISQNIVQLMEGEIWVESRENEGSLFSFTAKFSKLNDDALIKESKKQDEDTSLDNTSQAIATLQGCKLLLVEDNAVNQELACELLSINGMTVELANNGQEALDLLLTHDFDGILMDCQMPVMDGYEATRQIRLQEKYKTIPIIAMTANVLRSDVDKVLAVGMNDHIAKPIRPDTMFITMAKWFSS